MLPCYFWNYLFLLFQNLNVKIKSDLALFHSLNCSLEENMHSLIHAVQGNLMEEITLPFTSNLSKTRLEPSNFKRSFLLYIWHNFCVL